MLVDLVKFTANSSGTGAITTGSAVNGYRGVEALADGGTYSYSIQQEADWEFGQGTYLARLRTFVRSVRSSSAGGTPINLQPNASVAIVALAEDLYALAGVTIPVDTQALQAEIARATSAEAFLSSRIVAAALGIQPYANTTTMNADTTQPVGTFAVVGGTFYRYTSGGWIVDNTFRDALVAFVQPLVQQAQAAAVGSVPRATAVNVTTASGTTNIALTLPASLVLANGDIVEFRAPVDLTGPFTLQTDQFGTVSLRNRTGGPYSGLAFPVGATVRIAWNAAGSVWGEYSTATPLYVAQATDVKVDRALATNAIVVGAPTAVMVNGDPNNLTAVVPGFTDDMTFQLAILQTNTGVVTLAVGNRASTIANGGGINYTAGQLVGGNVYPMSYSVGGGKFTVNGSPRPIRPVPAPSGTNDTDLSGRPWGAVSFSGNTRTVTPVEKYVLVAGSSNANPDYVPPAQLPANVAAAALNRWFPADGLHFNPITVAQAGAPYAALEGQLGNSPDYLAGRVTWAVLFFGMNDARTLFYHSQAGVLTEIGSLRNNIAAIRAKGVEPVLCTIFPPDPRASAVALDPDFFARTDAFPVGGSTQDMNFPTFKGAPVDPETQMWPARSDVTIVQPWTLTGPARTGYKRIWHVNREIRRAASELGCVLLDVEQSTYRTVIEPLPDLGSGLEAYYETGNALHPKPLLYDMAVTPLFDRWAFDVFQGRTDRRVYA